MRTCEIKYPWRSIWQVKRALRFPVFHCCVLCTSTPACLNQFFLTFWHVNALCSVCIFNSIDSLRGQSEEQGHSSTDFWAGISLPEMIRFTNFAVFCAGCNARHNYFWTTGKLRWLSAVELGRQGGKQTWWVLVKVCDNGLNKLCE